MIYNHSLLIRAWTVIVHVKNVDFCPAKMPIMFGRKGTPKGYDFSVVQKILVNLYLIKQFHPTILFCSADKNSYSNALEPLLRPTDCLTHEFPDCMKVVFITLKKTITLAALCDPRRYPSQLTCPEL